MTLDQMYNSMIDLTEGFKTKADKMRILAQQGYKTADIARFLEVRYQQVRNTLEGDKRTGYSPTLAPNYERDEISTPIITTDCLRLIGVGEDGFAQIPPDLIDGLIEDDQQLLATPVEGGVFLTNLAGLTVRARHSFTL